MLDGGLTDEPGDDGAGLATFGLGSGTGANSLVGGGSSCVAEGVGLGVGTVAGFGSGGGAGAEGVTEADALKEGESPATLLALTVNR
jgi:hypothetical protein